MIQNCEFITDFPYCKRSLKEKQLIQSYHSFEVKLFCGAEDNVFFISLMNFLSLYKKYTRVLS